MAFYDFMEFLFFCVLILPLASMLDILLVAYLRKKRGKNNANN